MSQRAGASKLEVVKATPAHIINLVPRIAKQDLAEMHASTELPPEAALMKSMVISEYCWAVLDEDSQCIAVFGVAPLNPDTGIPWLIASDSFRTRWVEVARGSRLWRQILDESYSCLVNFVHVDNKTAIRWLEWLGFDIHQAIPFGVRGELFHPFSKGAHHV